MSARSFVDTNILVYAHDLAASDKRSAAQALVADLWASRSGALSTQVLQELYVTLRYKVEQPLECTEALALIEDYACWELVVNDVESVRGASQLEARYQISFWDALIIEAANAAGCERLYTEDLNHGQMYGRVRAVNPFVAPE
jgi:predicted nucleic acid-binding protein